MSSPTSPPAAPPGAASPSTFKDAIMHSPGPRTPGEVGVLAAKGFAMGAADIVPGVSGGTVAFVTGIYEQLLAAIASVNGAALKRLLKFDLKGLLAGVHLRFLAVLLFGIGVAVVSMAGLMHHLMETHPVLTWSTFFGLTLASVVVVAREVDGLLAPRALAAMVLGAVGAFFLVGMIPVQTPDALWFIFLAGAVAICAMILPGISGSFLLLIFGKYAYITGAIKAPFASGNLVIIAAFGAGIVVGILSFSRLLNWLLARARNVTMAVLTGFMIGALRKIWPYKHTLETTIIRDKVHVLREENVLPTSFDTEAMLALALAVGGCVLVLLLERVARKRGEARAAA